MDLDSYRCHSQNHLEVLPMALQSRVLYLYHYLKVPETYMGDACTGCCDKHAFDLTIDIMVFHRGTPVGMCSNMIWASLLASLAARTNNLSSSGDYHRYYWTFAESKTWDPIHTNTFLCKLTRSTPTVMITVNQVASFSISLDYANSDARLPVHW